MSDKKLFRSHEDRLLAGVCGGIAQYLEIDSTLVRLTWVLLIFAGIGIPAYIVAWIIIPEESKDYEIIEPEKPVSDKETRQRGVGILLFVFGLLLLLRNFFPWLGLGKLWPLLLIAAGIWLIISGKK
jgi:phage shock protein C